MATGSSQTLLLLFTSGLILMFMGISRLSDGMQRLAGDRIQALKSVLIKNRLIAALLGCLLTLFSQSSTATMILVVGVVNAGVISVLEGLAITLGANIGASLTLQLVALSSTEFLLPLLVVAAGLGYGMRHEKWREAGQALFGFALLLLGLMLMRVACAPLSTDHEFSQLLLYAGDNPWISLLLGVGLSALMQSSTAVAGLVLVVSVSGLLPFAGGVAMMLGGNLGATLAPNLVAVGSNLAARRTALAAFLLQLCSVLLVLLCFSQVLVLIQYLSPGEADFVVITDEHIRFFAVTAGEKPFIARHLVNAYTILACLTTLLFLPLLGLFAKLGAVLLQGQDESNTFSLKHIDYRVLNTPALALGQARFELRRMAHLAQETVTTIRLFLQTEDEKLRSVLTEQEQTLDLLQKEISRFLVALSQRSVSLSTSREIANMLHAVNDLERIGDHCQSLMRLVNKKRQQQITFSVSAQRELFQMAARAETFLDFVVAALDHGTSDAFRTAQQRENEIDAMEITLREQHMNRLHTGECSVSAGLIFIDMLHHLEKIADHTFKVARLTVSGDDDADRD